MLQVLQALNFPAFELTIKAEKDRHMIYDRVRRKFFVLTPEEWVRQHVIEYLSTYRKYPLSLFKVERGMKYNNLQKRSDVLVYSTSGKPFLLVECKAPDIAVDEEVLYQAVQYNSKIRAPYLYLTNGHTHLCLSAVNNRIQYLNDLPQHE